MKIKIKNVIFMEGQEEVIEQLYEGEQVVKNEATYLSYKDEEGIKNVIKLTPKALVLTRFGQQNTRMEFRLGQANAAIMTPAGLQNLTTESTYFEHTQGSVKIDYILSQHNLKFAEYKLEIRY
ncbi:DUF1934 domain-containing protein [Streptococcaceae bacterium ESL0729]|nr:DUF1934 domain-containing protein [Streptococcaceae bacterium ESL0729]